MKKIFNSGIEIISAIIGLGVASASASDFKDSIVPKGVYTATCLRVLPEYQAELNRLIDERNGLVAANKDTRLIDERIGKIPRGECWNDKFENAVMTAGKNLLLDSFITGSGFTQTGPYMGLISSVGWSAVSASDTAASHAGWTEAGSTNAPTFSARVAPSWSAASGGSKAVSAAVSFTMTSGGTLEGAFIVLGSGAVSTLMSTAGTLFSAGAFTGGAHVCNTGDVIQVTYTLSI